MRLPHVLQQRVHAHRAGQAQRAHTRRQGERQNARRRSRRSTRRGIHTTAVCRASGVDLEDDATIATACGCDACCGSPSQMSRRRAGTCQENFPLDQERSRAAPLHSSVYHVGKLKRAPIGRSRSYCCFPSFPPETRVSASFLPRPLCLTSSLLAFSSATCTQISNANSAPPSHPTLLVHRFIVYLFCIAHAGH
jgi:hypothetical protein